MRLQKALDSDLVGYCLRRRFRRKKQSIRFNAWLDTRARRTVSLHWHHASVYEFIEAQKERKRGRVVEARQRLFYAAKFRGLADLARQNER